MFFEDEVEEILNRWLKDCKIYFYFKPIDGIYRCEVNFMKYNIFYMCDMPYNRNLDAKEVSHRLLSNISSFIIKHFIRGDLE